MQLTMRNVSEMFKVSEATVTQWIRQQGLPAQHVAGQFRFNRVEVLDWAVDNRIKLATSAADHWIDSPPWVGLADALEAGGVHYKVPGHDREAALEAVVARLPLPEGFDRAFLLRLFQAREALGSTAVGDGIAIPHVRHPIVLNVPRSLVTLCFLKRPIGYQAPDGKPVRILFTVISTTVAVHVQLLSRLSRAFQDVAFRGSVVGSKAHEIIVRDARRIDQAEISGAQRSPRAA